LLIPAIVSVNTNQVKHYLNALQKSAKAGEARYQVPRKTRPALFGGADLPKY